MELHLERRAVLSTEPNLKSLTNDWCLRELEEDGEKHRGDLRPWPWGFHFLCREPKYAARASGRSSVDPETNKIIDYKAEATEVIFGTLKPHAPAGRRPTRFSFLATDREIQSFGITINRLAPGEPEYARMVGVISYTAEEDFKRVKHPDTLGFQVGLGPQAFDCLRRAVMDLPRPSIMLWVMGVDGIYDLWSPSKTTSGVKVLVDVKGQKLELANDCTIKPPCLGRVAEWNLRIQTVQEDESAAKPEPPPPAAARVPEPDEEPEPTPLEISKKAFEEPLLVVKVALWVIVGLLTLQLVR